MTDQDEIHAALKLKGFKHTESEEDCTTINCYSKDLEDGFRFSITHERGMTGFNFTTISLYKSPREKHFIEFELHYCKPLYECMDHIEKTEKHLTDIMRVINRAGEGT